MQINDSFDSHYRCFKMLANMVGTAFLLTHYYSLLNIGALVYMWHTMGFNGFSMVYLLTFIALLFEYYIWCRLVDSFQDVVRQITVEVMQSVHIIT